MTTKSSSISDILRAGTAEPREICITALGHLGFSCDPEHSDASLWIVTDGLLSRDCASHQEALDLAEDFRGWGYVVPAAVPQPVQPQVRDEFGFTVPSEAEPTPTHRWLDEEVHAWVKEILVELEEPEAPRRTAPELEAVIATREWLALYEAWNREPTEAAFGAVFDARVRLQDAHARLSAEVA